MNVTSLGADWHVMPGCQPTHEKELQRIAKARDRLIRTAHLPMHITKKALLISCSCSSLLDYVNPPSFRYALNLRSVARKAIGLSFGAPEIVYNCLCSSALDPLERAVLSALKLWVTIAQDRQLRDVLRPVKLRRSVGRLGYIWRQFNRRGWLLDVEHCEIGIWGG